MSIKNKALRGVYWTGIQQIGTQIITFVVSIILARLLLPEEFGLLAMIAIFVGLGNMLIQSGLTSSLIRSDSLDEDDYTTVFYFNLVISVLIYITIFFLAPYIAKFYNQDILTKIIRIYSLIFVIQAFSIVQNTRLTRIMDFKTQTFITIPALTIGGLTGVFMALYGFGIWSLVGYRLSNATANSFLYWFKTKWRPQGKFDKKKFKKHFNFGYKLTISGILDTIFTNLYNIIIGKFYPPAQVGFYQRASSFRMLPVGTITSIISKVSYPLLSQVKNETEKLKNIYKKIMQMILFLLAPLLITMGVLATPLFSFLFTDKWLPAVPYFQILIIPGILYPVHAYNLDILKVKGQSNLFLKLEVVKKIMISIVIFVSFQFGIYGLLYGSIVTSILALFINTHYSGRFINYKMWEQIQDILPIILLAVFTGLLTYFEDLTIQKITDNSLIRLMSGSLLSISIYLSLAYLFKIESLKEILKIIKERNASK